MKDLGYECVEPAVGAHLPLLDDPDLPADERARLEDHLAICDACRLRRALQLRVGAELASGRLTLPAGARRPRRRIAARAFAAFGGLAAAAGLALVLGLPPQARDHGLLVRGMPDSGMTRPVEGEVVAARPPAFRWEAIEGVSQYRVVVEEVGGTFRWQGETESTSLELPHTLRLVPGSDYRVRLETIPPDLAPPTGWSVSFSAGSWNTVLDQRLRHGQPAAYALLIVGALCAIVALVARRPLRNKDQLQT